MKKALQVELTFGKKNDTIDFVVRGKNFLIDGYVMRHFDSYRYMAASQMTHLTKKVESETSDKMVWPTDDWLESNYKDTVVEAILSNLQYYSIFTEKTMKENGIRHGQVVAEFKMPDPPKDILATAKKLIVEAVRREGATVKQAKAFADNVTYDGTCFIDRGYSYPATGSIGCYNLDWEYVMEEWELEKKGEAA